MALSIVGVGSDGQTTWQVTTVTTVKQSVDCLSKISANQNITDQLKYQYYGNGSYHYGLNCVVILRETDGLVEEVFLHLSVYHVYYQRQLCDPLVHYQRRCVWWSPDGKLYLLGGHRGYRQGR